MHTAFFFYQQGQGQTILYLYYPLYKQIVTIYIYVIVTIYIYISILNRNDASIRIKIILLCSWLIKTVICKIKLYADYLVSIPFLQFMLN